MLNELLFVPHGIEWEGNERKNSVVYIAILKSKNTNKKFTARLIYLNYDQFTGWRLINGADLVPEDYEILWIQTEYEFIKKILMRKK